MTTRERTLAAGVGSVLVLVAAAQGVRRFVYAPIVTARESITREQAENLRLRTVAGARSDVTQRWQALTAQTLAPTWPEAQSRFRNDMQELLERHGLSEVSVGPLPARIAAKTGIIETPLTINARGDLRQVMGFLCDFYRRGYLARLDRIRLIADATPALRTARSSERRRSGARVAPASVRNGAPDPTGPRLTLQMTATTIVLPREKNIPSLEIGPELELPDQGRLAQEVAEYALVADTNIFKVYEPPVVVRQDTTPTTNTTVRPTENHTKPIEPVREDPRKDADKLRLVSTVSQRGQLYVLVTDDRDLTKPAEKIVLNAPMDDGKLVLVHPRGVVVRVVENNALVDYFYPLGATFRDRAVLDPAAQPEVARELAAAMSTS